MKKTEINPIPGRLTLCAGCKHYGKNAEVPILDGNEVNCRAVRIFRRPIYYDQPTLWPGQERTIIATEETLYIPTTKVSIPSGKIECSDFKSDDKGFIRMLSRKVFSHFIKKKQR